MNARVLVAVTVLSWVAPAIAAGQGVGVSVQGALGSHHVDGGSNQSIALGISFHDRYGVVVNAEHNHRPTRVTFYPDGYDASRGASTRFISGEFRYVPATWKRLSPYVIAGVGVGVSRSNVDDLFPDRVKHTVMLVFPGGGVAVRMTEHLRAFVDVRAMFQSWRGEPDAGGFMPIRTGLAWRF